MKNDQIIEQKSNSEVADIGAIKGINKKYEYRLLLRLIKKHRLSLSKGKGFNTQAIVNMLNIDPKTSRKWLGTPRVQQALVEEMDFFIQKMQETGANDWRQWAKQIELIQGNNLKTMQK